MEFSIENYLLKSLSFLAFVSADEAKMLRANMVRKEFAKGEYICKEHTQSKGIYIIRKGKVKAFQTRTDGGQSIVYFFRRGDFFGHRPVLANEPYPISAVALDAVVVSYISKDLFLKVLSESETLARNLLVNLSKEFSVWVNKMTVFATYNVKSRVALSLLILHKVFERSDNDPRRTPISISRDDFADYVGTAKETLVRTLRYFKDEGIITTNRTQITILKLRTLQHMAENM